MTVYLVYMTAADRKAAETIGMALVKEKLAACVNLFDGMTSIYEWEGALHTESECAFIAKTTEERLPALISRVRALHSYACPCIVAMPISHGHTDFLKWVRDQTRNPGPVALA